MRHSVGSARDKHSWSTRQRFQLALRLRCSEPEVVGSTLGGKLESDSPESQSDGCARNPWAARGERSDARTPSLSVSSDLACRRGHNPSSEKSRVLDRRPISGDWKWPHDGCSDPGSATLAWGRRCTKSLREEIWGIDGCRGPADFCMRS